MTSDSGYIVVGTSCHDVYLIRVDKDGDTLWTRAYGSPAFEYGYSLDQTSDGGYIIAGYTEHWSADVYLVKTDADGDTFWTKTYGDTFWDAGWSVRQTSDAGYIIAGMTNSFDTVWHHSDVYVVKTDADGNMLWKKPYGGTYSDYGFSVEEASDSEYVIVGYTGSFGVTRWWVYLLKIDVHGNVIWMKTLKEGQGYSLQKTRDGGYIIAGTSGGDVCLIRTDADGDTVWTETYGGTDVDLGYAVRQTSDGGYIVVGETRSYGAGESDVYLIKIAPDLGAEAPISSRSVFFISASWPNPFQEWAFIRYQLLESRSVRVVIYNLLGQEVKTLLDAEQDAGLHTLIWDGRDNSGRKVSSGTYFLRLEAHIPRSAWTGLGTQEYTATRKLSVMR